MSLSHVYKMLTFPGQIPVFKPTSSPELDSLLAKFRDTLFIPTSLPLRHRKLIYKASKAEDLRQHPIIVNIGGEIEELYQLWPMDIRDRPKKNDVLNAVSLMKTRQDWHNLPPLLVGMRSSKQIISLKQWEWIVRVAGLAGMQSIVLECAKQARRSGLVLGHPGVARKLFFTFHSSARSAGFKGPELATALVQAQRAAWLMNGPEHIWTKSKIKDPKRLPDIIGILLELSAAHAIDAFEGKDKDGEVRHYAQKVLCTWPVGEFDVPPTGSVEANGKLLEFVPLWHGIKLALQVEDVKVDKTLSSLLASRLKELGQKIEETATKVSEQTGSRTTYGVELCRQLYHE